MAWRSLHLADGVICGELNRRLAEAGCSLLEHDLMAWLGVAACRRLRMLNLATRLRVTQGGLTRIVDRLVERGWVEREIPASNRREVYVTLTGEGSAALRRARAEYSRTIEQCFARLLDDGDLAALERIGQKLVSRMAKDHICLPSEAAVRPR